MEALFGPRYTKEDVLKAQERSLKRNMRELERSRRHAEMEADDLEKRARNLAKKGETEKARRCAEACVRARINARTLEPSVRHMETMKGDFSAMKTNEKVAKSVGNMARTHRYMNNSAVAKNLPRTAMVFQQERDKAGMNQELVTDTVDDLFDQEGQEGDEEVDDLLRSIGIAKADPGDSSAQELFDLPDAPHHNLKKVPAHQPASVPRNKREEVPKCNLTDEEAAELAGEDMDLLQRLNALK